MKKSKLNNRRFQHGTHLRMRAKQGLLPLLHRPVFAFGFDAAGQVAPKRSGGGRMEERESLVAALPRYAIWIASSVILWRDDLDSSHNFDLMPRPRALNNLI